MGIGKFALWATGPYLNDAIFDPAGPLNRDNCLSPWRSLKEQLAARGWECHTQDVYLKAGETPGITLFLDIPGEPVGKLLKDWAPKTRKWAVLHECEIVIPRNWDMSLHSQFERIFTWNEAWVDNKKYFKTNFSNHFPESLPTEIPGKEKLCVLISMQRKLGSPLELYSKREEAIRWFERNHPEDFDLYGRGWNEYVFTGPRVVRALNRIKPLKKLLAPKFPSYRGEVASKLPVLGKYKFCICYENTRDIPGYITEKIFDCLFAGCVPVYWGAPDIERYVPAACFVDRRKFPTHEALYAFLKGMSGADYAAKVAAGREFVLGKGPYQFSDRYFGETIAAGVADD
ncbi:MAG: glycosyltransferase family 10 [Elusimicrobiota bacterium]|nr:glycosyltransferase family 10 [Elusimicrobiota bacterium]